MKIRTKDSVGLVVEWFNNKGIQTSIEDWELLRKYKNFNGKTCRDFFHKTKELRCVFVGNEENDVFEIIENANFEYFLLSEKEGYFFYYFPVLSKDGIVFYFEPKEVVDNLGICMGEEEVLKYKEFLRKKLLILFPENDLSSFGDKLFFSFIGGDYQVIMNKLEKAKIKFNVNLYEYLDKNEYYNFIDTDSNDVFSAYKEHHINEEKSIKMVLAIFSRKLKLDLEDLSELKFLLKNIGMEEMKALKKIVSTFKDGKNVDVLNIFEREEKAKKIKMELLELWAI